MSRLDDEQWGCKEEHCASDIWKDGCEACMCYNLGNASRCDGSKSAYYDNYFIENEENPFGDSNRRNRKCNIIFSLQDDPCDWDWECGRGSLCGYINNGTLDKKCCPTSDKNGRNLFICL